MGHRGRPPAYPAAGLPTWHAGRKRGTLQSVAYTPIYPSERVKVRYKGSPQWLHALVSYTLWPRDPADPKMPDSVTVMVLNGTPFAVFRRGQFLHDCTGRLVEVQYEHCETAQLAEALAGRG